MAISTCWRVHEEVRCLCVYDMTMGCALRLWSDEGTHFIAGFSMAGDIDYSDGNYVEDFLDAESVWDGQALCWWDGTALREVPLKGAHLKLVSEVRSRT
jgi:hypothetical protein